MTMSVGSEIWMGLGGVTLGVGVVRDIAVGDIPWRFVGSEIWMGLGSVTLKVGVVTDIAVGWRFVGSEI